MPMVPFYQFAYATQLPTPGAMAYGLESEMMPVRPMLGPGIAARGYMRAFAPMGSNYQATALMWLTGVGGVAHGQSALQPLSNPYG